MLCEKCSKREAVVRYTVVKNGRRTEHNLCMECASVSDAGVGSYGGLFDGESQLGRLLSGILGFAMEQGNDEDSVDPSAIVCPVCQTSYTDFVKNSRFGCPDCYEVFELMMGEHIKTIQGSENHKGKKPLKMRPASVRTYENKPVEEEKISAGEQIAILTIRLKEAIREEDYESAARLRDEIRALKAEVSADE